MNKPHEPKRKKATYRFFKRIFVEEGKEEFFTYPEYERKIDDYAREPYTLADLVMWAQKNGVALDQVHFGNEVEYDYGDVTEAVLTIFFDGVEPDEEYNKRMAKYTEKLAVYEKWYEENREEIEREEAEKQARSEIYKEENRLKKIKKLKKDLARLEK